MTNELEFSGGACRAWFFHDSFQGVTGFLMVGFCGGRKTEGVGRKPISKEVTNNKLNLLVMLGAGMGHESQG